MKGKFITIEGCEGVGKSTLIDGLKNFFATQNIDVVFTREPGGTDIAEKIREVILDANNDKMTDTAELLLYASARAQHTEEKILPLVQQGKIVVCDRYSDSTLAYQAYGRGLPVDIVEGVNSIAENGIKIDATIFLDLSPSLGFLRKGGAEKQDRLEQQTLEFHERVYDGYKLIAKKNKKRFVVIDASKTKEEVLSSVIVALKERGIF